MDFTEFRQRFQGYPLILSRDVIKTVASAQAVRNQMNRWQKNGRLVKLRKGVYVLSAQNRQMAVDLNLIANRLYEPSYLSLEYALNFYGFIPEAVSDITSVTTRKTMRVTNPLGCFIYQHVQARAFRGFKRVDVGVNSFFIAEPEKAVVDFLYLNLKQFTNNVKDVLEGSYRFQNIEELNCDRLIQCAEFFKNEKLTRVVEGLNVWIKESRLS